MKRLGIDIGSRSIELVVLNGLNIEEMLQAETGHDPMATIAEMVDGRQFEAIKATGYGRHLLDVNWDTPMVTEIKAYAGSVYHQIPMARTILDIGGQDTKVIGLRQNGRIRKFEMNDRCAAGTGKFLEVMAKALEYSLDQFGESAMNSAESLTINSMCTVFAESEVTSLVTRGVDRAAISRGLHESVARRAMTMLNRINWAPPLVFAGGVALNPGLIRALEMGLNTEIIVPENPQYMGALGAALLA